jgi:hypothetical protein
MAPILVVPALAFSARDLRGEGVEPVRPENPEPFQPRVDLRKTKKAASEEAARRGVFIVVEG